MPDQAKPVSRPWRRFLRFSVRGLIVLVLVIGAWLGWLVRSARIQRDAVAAITKAGGASIMTGSGATGTVIPGGRPSAPRWLVDLIGVDYFGHVIDVSFHTNTEATDATFAQIGRLTQLWRLMLIESSVNDASLSHLKGLTDLHSLELCKTLKSRTPGSRI